jgi:beta-glucosidase
MRSEQEVDAGGGYDRGVLSFPDDFLWGAATAAYQIEGSPLADGAGPSIWHRFCHTPGRVANGDTGDVACDHYRRWRDDVALMRALGLRAYRFSIAWGRVLPAGSGAVNQRGLDFYRRLVDALLAAGIVPLATLYHWDLPAALDDRGGWLDRDVASRFGEYAEVCYRALPGVALWATINEPWVVADGGYLHGVLAPGHRNLFEAPRAAHHLLLAHAAAVAAHRASGRGEVGVVVNLEPKHPASEGDEDRAAAARADAQMNRHYLDALVHGRYPEELAEVYGAAWAETERQAVRPGDLEAISAPFDWLGVNYYSRSVVRADPSAWPTGAAAVRQPRSTYTTMDWEVYPDGLREVLGWVKERYGERPLLVTENGAAFYDPPRADAGAVDDPLRVAYLRDHLRAVAQARAAGVDVRGYFVWSLLDNLEWSAGFSQRFGIVHVDFTAPERTRTPKASARWYAEVVRTNGASLSP